MKTSLPAAVLVGPVRVYRVLCELPTPCCCCAVFSFNVVLVACDLHGVAR